MNYWAELDLGKVVMQGTLFENQSHQYAKRGLTLHCGERWANAPFVSRPSLQFKVYT